MASILQQRQSVHQELKKLIEDNKALQQQLDNTQPLVNLGLVSAMIAHEINNILTPMGSYAQLAAQHPDDAELKNKVITKTIANTERAAKILQALLAMANGQKHQLANHSIKEMVDEIFDCLARDFSKDRITLHLDIAEDVSVVVDKICFEQVLMNLIINARQALMTVPENASSHMPGSITISACCNENTVDIKIADTACGIPEENLDKIFEPFFTTKDCSSDQVSRAGAGLGLSFCKRVIEAHNGTIEVDSQEGVGTTFTIKLPKS